MAKKLNFVVVNLLIVCVVGLFSYCSKDDPYYLSGSMKTIRASETTSKSALLHGHFETQKVGKKAEHEILSRGFIVETPQRNTIRTLEECRNCIEGDFSLVVDGLLPNTAYTAKAFVELIHFNRKGGQITLLYGNTIEFNTDGPTVITIITHPSLTTNLTAGNITSSLSVTARATYNATLFYRWYSATTNINTGGAPISDATAASFDIPTMLAPGTYYYFCEISADGGAAPIRSNVATVNVAEQPVIVIDSQPEASTNLIVGAVSGSLAVGASVSLGETLSYQWYTATSNSNTGGVPITNATSESFTIPTTLAAGVHYFFCELHGSGGAASVRSDVATVLVALPAITIVSQPATNTTQTVGNIAGDLSVEASVTGNATLSYQWYSSMTNSNMGGTPIEEATTENLTIPTTLAVGTYYFFCEIAATDGAIDVRTIVATVNVMMPVITITTQPEAITNVTTGNINAILFVEASVTGKATLSYQWYRTTSSSNTSGTAIEGETEASFAIPTILTGSPYYYFCEVRATDGATSVRSIVARVNVTAPVITITTHPATTTNLSIGSITGNLSVEATVTGNATLSYQWYSNAGNSSIGGTPISDATSASFNIPTTLTAGAYYYFCEVSANDGVATRRSNVARVNVANPSITINTHPAASTNVTAGSITGSLSVAASVTGNATLSYQWYSNTTNSDTDGTPISVATSATFTIPTTLTGGTYYYFCEVRANDGVVSLRSHVAIVNVAAPVITINNQPAATTNFTPGNITGSLSVTATVTENATLSYQWYSNISNSNMGGTPIAGATSASFTIPATLSVGSSPYFYFCDISAPQATSVRSDVAIVNVFEAGTPIITINTQPAATTNVTAGFVTGSLTVAASVTENATLSYQWYRNTTDSSIGGVAISGATSASFTIPTTLTTTGSPYYYFCEVRATGATSVRSNIAGVNVNAPVLTVFTENFENGSGYSLPGWTIVNGWQTNWWNVGTATANGGSRSIYITDDNNGLYAPYVYDILYSSTVHFYRNFNIYSTTDNPAVISFDLRVQGESNYDYLIVSVIPTTTNPVAGSLPPAGVTILSHNYSMRGSSWQRVNITLPAMTGNRRIVFTWRNDNSIGTQPPAAIDNIRITNVVN